MDQKIDNLEPLDKWIYTILLDGSFTGVTIQAGNTTAETITLSFVDMASSGLSIDSATVATQSDAKVAIGTMDTALQTISQEQAKFGSLINRLDYSISNQSRASVMTEQALGRIMDADFATIQRDYDRACHLCLPGGATAHGRPAADAFWIGLRAAFPSARFDVHHVIGRDADPMMPPRAAVRWSLTGTHDGWGAFGAPSGAPVHVMGISHAEYGPRGLRREWVLFDETSIWMQILLHKGG